ncbi:MAG TPA: bifunctional diaminohydroxyphosphoribosylaminopyrimidine deaminase/5-amino-6-(5-phosphoribosylamino)uracil reductase RibD [Verrucomicrobiae bacterium]|nr:bifunctional diaminohydroxyphosphoribosylaminopyrimidine deaminase/5-amino-6-(5-phosphoribosylamino)uracil reductase RibD [Verrucomicrobiae bacterium]
MTAGDLKFLREALQLARRGYGATSPNPMVGAVLVRSGKVIGRGWHHRAGLPHAEIEALRDAQQRQQATRGATLYVTLEPCCTHGRTPPCTDAIIDAGIRRVVVGTPDPNPKHAGKGLRILRRAGIEVVAPARRGQSADAAAINRECSRLNEAFNHWIVHRTPFVTVKAAMTLDGKIATAAGESKWITSEKARTHSLHLRQGSDAILVGVNTVLLDDPSLTARQTTPHPLRRIVLDSLARTPLTARVVTDANATLTTLVVSRRAPRKRVAALAQRVQVLVAPTTKATITSREKPGLDLRWLLRRLGAKNVTSLLVEGGGEVNASFLLGGLAQRVAFFYAPKILGGREARRAVAGVGAASLAEVRRLKDVEWHRLGPDLLLTALVENA